MVEGNKHTHTHTHIHTHTHTDSKSTPFTLEKIWFLGIVIKTNTFLYKSFKKQPQFWFFESFKEYF